MRLLKDLKTVLCINFLLKCLRLYSGFFACEPGHEKTCLMPYADTKGADQPAHLRSLISIFAVRCLDSMICILIISKVSRF